MARPKSKIYYAVAYLRLSREDGDKGESNSITNQKKLIQDYVSKSKDIKLVGEFQDDGFTGTNFNRPGFQNLMEMLEKGKADCVIVKDLSRLGRDYIETGKYIEKVFPSMGVRFIALNDNVDSLNRDASDEIVIPFKNLINDSYCRELSNKLRIQYRTQRKNGEFIGNFACFGYMKSPDDKHKLIIDEEAAQVVRLIYAKRIEGYSCKNIAGYLNTMGFLSPSDYKVSKGHNYKCGFKQNTVSKWGDKQVRRILTNRVYVGDLEQGKRGTPNYKIKKMQEKKKEDWIIVKGAHDPIVSEETFDTVQKIMQMDAYTAPSKETAYPLCGILFCADCHSTMYKRKVVRRGKEFNYYVCIGYRKKICSSGHSMEMNRLHEKVLNAIRLQIHLILEMEEFLNTVNDEVFFDMKLKRLKVQENEMLAQLEQHREFRLKLYENRVEGMITDDEYFYMREKYSDKIEETMEILKRIEEEKDLAFSKKKTDLAWMDSFKENRNVTELTRELVVTLIDRIEVSADKSIEITFRFKDEFKQLKECVDKLKEDMAG